ncbi:MAG: uroporphyrinogen decarboxylase [Thermodesulfovibrio sp.]|uniref:uroporphyrinogen decarboxylase n=1 Tax=unclassified Thermodesulfovibrio TaxID=2645936 RepID=UPI00083AEC76|nr:MULTISPECIES: uroporphyrinogen decarboxylase [unclassified Thermodesulfovibrio]MDI1472854.1 uroporphyrinogen decarboxylase [Thermodesulfovibrio sp. 1176]MDI6714905.1 uroporphyrinogen decarboxylase [Thermodesulfovibrio sp.]ODA44509.1 Uroporphyrinogen III decarboxylase [Thermodesulfovibrio sp. N1]
MRDTFLKACRGIKTDYTPVWFMRQAGRYMPEYQKIRQKYDFLTMCKTPEISAEITMQPIRILNVDAAILFSDILIPLEAMGLKIDFIENIGPKVTPSVKTGDHLGYLKNFELEKIEFVFKTIKILIKELDVPLIGFSASPFTLATYVIEGSSSKDFVDTKRFMFSEPDNFHNLMEILTEATFIYLNEQIEAGVHAIQIFDTWAGILSPFDYEIFCKPYVKKIIENLKRNVPIIYFCPNLAGLAKHINDLIADVISLDWRINLREATKLISDKVMQGNLDPLTLLGSEEELFKRAELILKDGRFAKSHIFNLGHGVNINTSVERLKKLVDFIHEFKFEGEV